MNKKLITFIATFGMIVVLGGGMVDAAPNQIITNGSKAVWDIHNGSNNKFAEKTTFNLEKVDVNKMEYPEFLSEQTFVGDEVVIKMIAHNEKQQKWIDEIDGVYKDFGYGTPEKLDYRIENSINKEGKAEQNLVLLPQRKIDSNNKYKIIVKAGEYPQAKGIVEIVEKDTPRLLLVTPSNPRVGEEIAFKYDGLSYALLNPVKELTIKKINEKTGEIIGDAVKYEKGKDFFITHDILRISKPFTESGVYELEVKADGHKNVVKRVYVHPNSTYVPKSEDSLRVSRAIKKSSRIDVMSSATSKPKVGGGTSGGSSSGSSGSTIDSNVYLSYDEDMLSNAIILNRIGLGNEQSEKIVKAYEQDEIKAAVVDNSVGIDGVYKYAEFENYMNDYALGFHEGKKVEKKYISFDEYKKLAKEGDLYKNKPYSVRKVLQDGTLGESVLLDDILGFKAPKVTILNEKHDEDIVLKVENTEDIKGYLNHLEISVVGGGRLSVGSGTRDSAKVDVNAGTITIAKDKIKKGKFTIVLKSEEKKGYKIVKKYIPAYVTVNYLPEEAKSLFTPIAPTEIAQNTEVKVSGFTDDMIKNIKGIRLNAERMLTKEAQGSTATKYYTLDKSKKEIILSAGNFDKAGKYTLSLDTEYYRIKPVTIVVK